MIRLHTKIPENFILALSGGPDSMAALDFFQRGRKNFKCAYFDHGTSHSHDASLHVSVECKKRGIGLIVKSIDKGKIDPKGSLENEWRKQRIAFFNSLKSEVITAHNLDDAVEWWVFTSFHGNPRIIPTRNKNILRPFLTTSKKEILEWNSRNNVISVSDPGNKDVKFMRTIVRHEILPSALKVNPGIRKVIKKKIIKENNK